MKYDLRVSGFHRPLPCPNGSAVWTGMITSREQGGWKGTCSRFRGEGGQKRAANLALSALSGRGVDGLALAGGLAF